MAANNFKEKMRKLVKINNKICVAMKLVLTAHPQTNGYQTNTTVLS